jgi:hypothetical protein
MSGGLENSDGTGYDGSARSVRTPVMLEGVRTETFGNVSDNWVHVDVPEFMGTHCAGAGMTVDSRTNEWYKDGKIFGAIYGGWDKPDLVPTDPNWERCRPRLRWGPNGGGMVGTTPWHVDTGGGPVRQGQIRLCRCKGVAPVL